MLLVGGVVRDSILQIHLLSSDFNWEILDRIERKGIDANDCVRLVILLGLDELLLLMR